MYDASGLQGWEIVAASGLCAAGVLLILTTVVGAVSWLVCREPAARPVAVAKPVPHPTISHQPEFAGATA